MSFTNKIKNALQDVTSIGTEKIDETSFNLKISEKRNDIRRAEEEIGALIYAEYSKESRSFGDDVVKICERITSIMDDIDVLEKQKLDMMDKARAERDKRREEND